MFVQRNCEWLIKSVIVYLIVPFTIWITVVILELIHANYPDFSEGVHLLDTKKTDVIVPSGAVAYW